MEKVVIIGGVAAGASAAARLRRLREDLDIIMLDKGPYISFANCGLPYYVGNVIKDRESLELMTPQLFKERFNIDVRIYSEATSIEREKKTISVRNLMKGESYTLDYDYLVLTPGSTPLIPPFPGLDHVPSYSIWTIPDAVKIRDFVDKYKIKHAVVVGGGFIGLEMAENLVEKGVKVKIVEMLDQVMPPIDKEMAQFIHQELILNGICLVLEDPVDSFGRTKADKPYVKTKSGREIETDLIILSIGIKPQTELAKQAGLKVGSRGHIIVNKHMQTSDPSIFAAGDAVLVEHLLTKEPVAIALAGPANKQGRITADNIAGKHSKYNGILGALVVKVFDMTVASVGLTEKQLKQQNVNYDKVYVHPNNHASYYPNAVPLAFKLLFEVPSGKVLGAQVIGGLGSDKRIDVISTVIKMGGTVFDLEELELTYAPPYGSAKDPINMAGFVASNYLRGDMPIQQWHHVKEFTSNGRGVLLDVRTVEEFQARNIGGSINIPIEELRERIDEIPKGKPILAYCEVGYRSYLATRILLQNGFKDVYDLTGGFKTYEMANATTEEIVAACGSSDIIMEELVREKAIERMDYVEIDCSGLTCPGPLNAMIKALEILPEEKELKVYATDPGFKSSVEAYAKLNEAVELTHLGKEEGKLVAKLRKGKVKVIEAPLITKPKKLSHKDSRGSDAPPVSQINADELYERLKSDDAPALLVDVRTPQEFSGPYGHIKNSKLIPLGELMYNTDALENFKEAEIVVICHSGSRSMMAAQLLAQAGYKDLRNLNGGMLIWNRKGFPVEDGSKPY